MGAKEFAIFGSIISISLVISGIFSYSQARFLVEGIKIKNLNIFATEVISIQVIPIILLLIILYFFESYFLNENISKFYLFISLLIICSVFKNFFLNYQRIINNYKNFLYFYIFDKISLLISLIIFFFTKNFDLLIYIYSILNLIIIIPYFLKFKKINLNFTKNYELIKSSRYNFLINLIAYLISLNIIIFIITNIAEYQFASAITLGVTIYSLLMIPLAFLETFLGPIIARIFKLKTNKIYKSFIDNNLINYLFIIFILFFISKLIILNFEIIKILFPKYADQTLIIFAITYKLFFSFIKFYFFWFFNAANKLKRLLKYSFFQLIIIYLCFYFFKNNLELFLYLYIVSYLFFSIFIIIKFNNIKKHSSYNKIIFMLLIVIFDFTVYYFFENYIFLSYLLILPYIIYFIKTHLEFKNFILKIYNLRFN